LDLFGTEQAAASDIDLSAIPVEPDTTSAALVDFAEAETFGLSTQQLKMSASYAAQ
jgi:hypothetical protein